MCCLLKLGLRFISHAKPEILHKEIVRLSIATIYFIVLWVPVIDRFARGCERHDTANRCRCWPCVPTTRQIVLSENFTAFCQELSSCDRVTTFSTCGKAWKRTRVDAWLWRRLESQFDQTLSVSSNLPAFTWSAHIHLLSHRRQVGTQRRWDCEWGMRWGFTPIS